MKRKLVSVLSCLAVCAACSPALLFRNSVAEENTTNLFYSDGVAFTTRAQVPQDAYTGDKRYGLKLTADNDGERATLSTPVTGKFEMDFAVYSENDYDGDAASPIYSNDYADLQELAFTFTDKNNAENSFEVVFAPGYAGNCVTPTARVRARGREAGIVSVGNSLNEQTAIENNAGVYTALEGASFSNKAYKGSQILDDVKSIVLTFDPDSMCVYAKANGGLNRLVWNFSNQINDAKDIGFTLDKMEEYQVSIVFNDIVDGKEANMLVYSVNGRDTSWHYLAGDERVGISTNVEFNGAANQPYAIPVPKFTDNLKNATVDVIGPISKQTFALTDGLTFTPIFAGNYTLVYNAVSDEGVHSSAEYTVEVFDETPQTQFAYSSVLYSENYGVGSSVRLPKVSVQGGLLKRDTQAQLSIYRDGELVDGYENTSEYGDTFTFTEVGEYVFKFASPDGTATQEYTFMITETLPVFAAFDFAAEVAFGTNVTLAEWQISKGGAACAYTVQTTKPDGTKVDGKDLVADQLGIYETRYTVSYGENESATYYRYFTARNSSIDAFLTQSATVQKEIGTAWFNNNLTGVILSADTSFSAEYVNEIDLSDNTKDDLLVELAVIPEIIATENFSQLLLTFTDVENSDNYFVIELLSGSQSGDPISRTYVKAGAPNQIRSGMQNGSRDRLHIGGRYGTFSLFSFSGYYTAAETGNKTMRLYYDNTEKSVYLCYQGDSKVEIVDFDDPACFNTLWGGLTSGKVRMTVQTQGYAAGKASVLLKSVDGFDLTKEYLVEEEKPFIVVDTLDYAENQFPNAVVGKAYDLFAAKAYGKLQGALDYAVEVYYDYGGAEEEKVDITNGFTPNKVGEYTVIYSVEDFYHTTNQKMLTLRAVAVDDYAEIRSNVSSADDKRLFVGERDTLKAISAYGGVGDLKVETSLVDEDGAAVEVNAKNEFILEKAGTYTVLYKVTDYLHTEKTFAYTIECSISEKPIVNDEAYLPNGFVRGFTYTLPEIVAYDYSESGEKRKAKAQISVWSEDGDELYETVAADGKYTAKAEHGDNVIVKYVIGGANGYLIKNYTVAIHDVVNTETQDVDKSKLFVTQNVSQVVAEESYLTFTLEQNAKIGYINSLTENSITFRIGAIVDAENAIGRVKAYFTDSKNANIRVRVDMVFDGSENVKLYNNGVGAEVVLNGSMLNECNVFKFVYRNGEYSLCDNNGVILYTFEETVNGDTFAGFTSGKVNVDFEMENVTGSPKFVIAEIGKYNVNSETDDSAPPQIYFKDEIKGFALVGDTVYLPAAISADVVSPTAQVLVKVTVNGKVVKDVDGIDLQNVDGTIARSFVASQTGIYRVTYLYSDALGNSNEYHKAVSVVEKNAPTLIINGDVQATAKVGDTIDVPDFTVSDDTTATDKIKKKAYVITHTGTFVSVDGDYTFEETGTYTLRYVAYDEFYNYTITDFTIEVTE